ncbi:MAG: hypothetical protein JKY27_11575, partial [Magnetovibrio sp.]|nr:hypothetical protein [Magnetovibrio sp.]
MKLPFIHKLSALKGVFARLNPAALIAKIKAKKSADDADEDDLLVGDDDADLFGDLGDLDQLDVEAAEKADELADFDENAFDDDEVADLNAANTRDDAPAMPAVPGKDDDLVSEIMDDLESFDIGAAFEGESDEDDDEEAQKAKLKKLIMLAGGGVAAAVVLGGVAWWLLGGDEGPMPQDQIAAAPTPGRPGDLVIALDDVPPYADDTPVTPVQQAPAPRPQVQQAQDQDGLVPPASAPVP